MYMSMGITVLNQKKIEEEEFLHIMEEHKKWLENTDTGKRADLSDIDLSDMDLSGMDFSNAYMVGVNLRNSNLTGANLSNANLWQAFMFGADLTRATIEGTIFQRSEMHKVKLNECKGKNACFMGACMWECEFVNAELSKAIFTFAEVCDSDFSGADLEGASFMFADLDNAVFSDTNMKKADLSFSTRHYWSDFKNADLTGAWLTDVDLDPDRLEGAKGYYQPICCPEEGSFIAWKKCRDGKVVKLLIPEHAERKGTSLESCRASEAQVLEIYDKDGNPVDEAISIIDEEFKYVKGTTAIPKDVNPRYHGDVTGIYFVLSRAETENYTEKKEDNDEDDEDEWD